MSCYFKTFSKYFAIFDLGHLILSIIIQCLLLISPENITYYKSARQFGLIYRDVPELGLLTYIYTAVLHLIYLMVVMDMEESEHQPDWQLLSGNPVEFWLDKQSDARKVVTSIIDEAELFIEEGRMCMRSVSQDQALPPRDIEAKIWKWYVEVNLFGHVLSQTERIKNYLRTLVGQVEGLPFGFRYHQDPEYEAKMRKLYRRVLLVYISQFVAIIYQLTLFIDVGNENRQDNPLLEEELKMATILDFVMLVKHIFALIMAGFWFRSLVISRILEIFDFIACIKEERDNFIELDKKLELNQKTKQFSFHLDPMATEVYLKYRILEQRAIGSFRKTQEYIIDNYFKGFGIVFVYLALLLCTARDVNTILLMLLFLQCIFLFTIVLAIVSISTHRYIEMTQRIHDILTSANSLPVVDGCSRTMSPFLYVSFNNIVQHEELVPIRVSIRLFNTFRVDFGFIRQVVIFTSLLVTIVYHFRYQLSDMAAAFAFRSLISMLWFKQFQRQEWRDTLRRKKNSFLWVVKLIPFVLITFIAIPFVAPFIVSFVSTRL